MLLHDDHDAMNALAPRILDTLMRLAFPVLLGVAGWTWTNIADHEARIKFIEGTRYTSQDRDRDFNKITEELQKLAIAQAVTAQQITVISENTHKIEQALAAETPRPGGR